MAGCGVGSRRQCEELIRAGRVRVDGEVATLGMSVDPERQIIFVDGKRVLPGVKRVSLMVNKPKGYVSTTSDPQGRPKVTDLVKIPGVRLFPVGRLDYQTSGLLLLTNDGELAYLVTHPRYGIWKTYHALVKGRPDQVALQKLRNGVPLPEGVTAPARVRVLQEGAGMPTLLEISLREGKKRQVRKMCAWVGCPVLELRRVSLAFLQLNDLPEGQYRFLTETEVARLKQLAVSGENSRRLGAQEKNRRKSCNRDKKKKNGDNSI